ncbi:MAG TPA: hypothetical protein PKB08_00775 [Burkholderiaceae bacterium]|jgi:hypothetical protein|nr:hypothetical protein [Burkholderiaceae bacterium]
MMTIEVNVRFAPGTVFSLSPKLRLGSDEARRWLDEQFVALGAEPMRASGKVLVADKVLAVAAAAGAGQFRSDAAWADRYAASVVAALGRDVVRVETDTSMVTY